MKDDKLTGLLIDGRYRVARLVGEGGFGQVYEAFHVGLESPVALKVPTLFEGVGPEQRSKQIGLFLEEARTLKRLRHPNIVAALDVGFLPEDVAGVQRPYLIMEWCRGPTLKQWLNARGGQGLSLAQAWAIFEPLLDALAYAHAEGIAHRDLKPANVLCETSPGESTFRPRIIDFGIAKQVAPGEQAGSGTTHTTSGRSPFTPQYASPEQFAGTRTGPWTDVHALALIFVEMLLGRSVVSPTPEALLALIDPERPTPGSHGIDVGELEPVLARALAVRPSERYPDADAFARAMRGVLSGLPAEDTAALSTSLVTEQDTAPEPFEATQISTSEEPGDDQNIHTAITEGGEAAPQAQPGSRWRGFSASLLALLLALSSLLMMQHHRGKWPFLTPLRDLSGAELERRVAGLDLGPCFLSQSPNQMLENCSRGIIIVSEMSSSGLSQEEFFSLASQIAFNNQQLYGAARFAVDGKVLLLLAGTPSVVDKTWEKTLAGLSFERTGVPAEVPLFKRSGATELKAWTGDDMLARCQATGAHFLGFDASQISNSALLREHEATISVSLLDHGQIALDALRSNNNVPFAYALDGDRLLWVSGGEGYPSFDFLCRLLSGTSYSEVGLRRPGEKEPHRQPGCPPAPEK